MPVAAVNVVGLQIAAHAHRARSTRAVFVIGITVIAITRAPQAVAQSPSDRAWWGETPGPPAAMQAALIHTVQTTPANALDPSLPPIALDEWLWVTLSPVVEHLPARLVDWQLGFCLDRRSALPGPAPELCAHGTVALSADRHLRIEIAIAEAVPPRSAGRASWRQEAPSLRDVYIERLDGATRVDSLDVPSLSQGTLRQLRMLPFDQWPTAAFESTIAWDPPDPGPGGGDVKFSISVRNTGTRSVDRAWISILISPCCSGTEVRREWFPRIAAGESVRLEAAVRLPEGQALAMLSVRPWQGDKIVRESNPGGKATVASVGAPPRTR
jgi:hypothetical protein